MNGLWLFFVGHRISDSVFCWSEMDGLRLSSANFGGRGLSIGPPIVSLHRAKMSPTNDKMHADREPWVALVAPGDFLSLAKMIILELEKQLRGCASVRYTAQCTLYM